ncbi:hypothetical protein M514_03387 [Trichuris suis]|uniref:Uncharacterized protein n=1 Tax=Trichuris suis TaxID=68888 RepID=A0A085MEJ3_9BILA|nr:hypothetical protein M513_03387 [Trichuris suis]KFD68051.1 hypothetical protein M514_03387 [Trichuris suis]KHJ47971.1 hypothetical protein D918_01236 [Trichuris suis]
MAVARCVHLGFYVPCIMALLTFAHSSSEFPNVPLTLDSESARSSIAPGDRRNSVLMVHRQNLDMLLDVYLSLADAAQKLEFLIQGSNPARQPGRKKRQNNASSDKRYDMNTWEFMRFGK